MRKLFVLFIFCNLGIASLSLAAPRFVPVEIQGKTYYRDPEQVNDPAYYEAYADDGGVTYVRVYPSLPRANPGGFTATGDQTRPAAIHMDRNGNYSIPKHQQYDPTPYNNRSGNDRTPYNNRSGNDRTPYNNRSGNDRTPYNNRSGYDNRSGYNPNSGYR